MERADVQQHVDAGALEGLDDGGTGRGVRGVRGQRVLTGPGLDGDLEPGTREQRDDVGQRGHPALARDDLCGNDDLHGANLSVSGVTQR